MEQHMIAIDLDGTTLNNKSQLSDTTIQTLRTLDAMGHMVCIVTGRPYRTSKDIYRQLNINNGLVNFNGALCHFPGHDNWLPGYHRDLDKEIAFEIFSNQESLEIDVLLAEGRDQLYTSSMNMPESPFYPTDYARLARLSRESLTYNPTALTILCQEDKQAEIEARIMDHYGDLVSVRTWGGILPVLEVVRSGINKAVGVKRMADFYHIPQDKILAFGDENNDLEMLEFAGLGVAMKNGTAEVKEIADTETEFSNNEDGLARFLMNYFSL